MSGGAAVGCTSVAPARANFIRQSDIIAANDDDDVRDSRMPQSFQQPRDHRASAER